jgi:hypothetical protein
VPIVTAGECIIDEEGGGADSAQLTIRFVEGAGGGSETNFRGFRVTITPNPIIFTHQGSLLAFDDGLNDDDDGTNIGEIVIDDACQTDHADFPGPYTLVADITPGSAAAAQGCELGNGRLEGQTVTGPEGVVRVFEFVVYCTTSRPAPGSPPAAPASIAPQASAPSQALPDQSAEADSGPPPAAMEIAGPLVIEVTATGDQEVPSVSDAGRAFGRFTFDEEAGSLDYYVVVSGYSANQITGAHIQRGASGSNGPIVHDLSSTGFILVSGTLNLGDADIADLKAENLYFSVKSGMHPEGFARAQLILPQPTVPSPSPEAPEAEPTAVPDQPAAPGQVSPPRTGSGGLLSVSR